MKSKTTLLFLGDVYIREQSILLSSELKELFNRHDFISCNFEAPVVPIGAKTAQKIGPCLAQSEKAIDFVTKNRISLINLANNHMFDYGAQGFEHTLKLLKNKIVLGAGKDFKSANLLKIIKHHDVILGFLSFGEAEHGILSRKADQPGFAWVNHPEVDKRIFRAKKQVDMLFVQAHAGVEEIDIPLPEWRQRYRELVNAGADAVIGHHPHTVQGWEIYKQKPIFYSLGNFSFEAEQSLADWNTGLIVSFEVQKNKSVSFQTFLTRKTEKQIRLLSRANYSKLDELNQLLIEPRYTHLVASTTATLWQERYLQYYRKALGTKQSILVEQLVRRVKPPQLVKINYPMLNHLIQVESHYWTTQRALAQIIDYQNHIPAPIVLFVYNRPDHILKTLASLRANYLARESQLFIFSDSPKNKEDQKKVAEVRNIIYDLTGFKQITIHENTTNQGLAGSITKGITKIISRYGKVIVLEDDLITSPYFLTFMNQGLDIYQNEPKVASIHGFTDPAWEQNKNFFLRGADCWGWATWKDRWQLFEPDSQKLYEQIQSQGLQKKFDRDGISPNTAMLKKQMDGKIDSWAIRWHASMFLQNKLTLYPHHSLVRNIGHDASGTHGSINRKLINQSIWIEPIHMTHTQPEETVLSHWKVKLKNAVYG